MTIASNDHKTVPPTQMKLITLHFHVSCKIELALHTYNLKHVKFLGSTVDSILQFMMGKSPNRRVALFAWISAQLHCLIVIKNLHTLHERMGSWLCYLNHRRHLFKH